MKINKDGDGIIQFQQGGTTVYIMGIDESDGDKFKIHYSDTALADTSNFTIDSNGNITTGIWNGSTIAAAYIGDISGYDVKSTGETGGNKYLREDGDGTCSWQTPSVASIAVDDLTDASTTGTGSIYLGGEYGHTNSTYNTGIGIGALADTGISVHLNNTAIGFDAGNDITTGDDNVFIGYLAGNKTTDIDKSVIIGSEACGSIATELGDGLIAIGYKASNALTDGSANTFIGFKAGLVNTTGHNNTIVGYNSFIANSTGSYNTAIGSNTLQTQTGDNYNTAIGHDAGKSVNGGEYLTLLGASAGQSITTSDNSTCLGYNSGKILTTGSNCIYIGSNTTASSASVSTEIVIGNGLTGKGANKTFIGGTTGPYNQLNTTTWNTTSDIRLKKNIINSDIGLEQLDKIRLVKYQFKDELPKQFNYDSKKTHYGIIAQEAEGIIPNLVTKDKEGWYSVNSDPLFWCSIQSLKELHQKYIETQKILKEQDNEIELIENNINKIQTRLEKILIIK